jgi:hypothetical protein
VNCATVKKLVYDYCDGRLFGLERKMFEEHVSSCPDCARELDEQKAFFTLLDRLEPEQPPVWFEETVVRKLKLEGIIYEPKVPLYKKTAAAVNRAPDMVKYPVAALVTLLVVYLPLRLLMVFLKGVLAKATVFISERLVALEQALENVSFFSRFFEVVAKDIRALKTVSQTFLSLLSSAYGGIVLPSFAIFILVTILVIRHLRNPRRRSHNAPTRF